MVLLRFLCLSFFELLAANGKNAVVDGDLDVLLLQAGKLRSDDELVVELDDSVGGIKPSASASPPSSNGKSEASKAFRIRFSISSNAGIGTNGEKRNADARSGALRDLMRDMDVSG